MRARIMTVSCVRHDWQVRVWSSARLLESRIQIVETVRAIRGRADGRRAGEAGQPQCRHGLLLVLEITRLAGAKIAKRRSASCDRVKKVVNKIFTTKVFPELRFY